MSRDASAAARFFGRAVLLDPQHGRDQVAALLARCSEREPVLGRLGRMLAIARAGDDGERPDRPAAWTPPYLRARSTVRPSGLVVSEGVAVLDVRGPLLDRALVWGDGEVWCDGYDRISAALDEARLDSAIQALLIRFDTPGGLVDGLEGCARSIRAVSAAGKPVHGYVGAMALSAGYWLAAACDRIVSSPEGLTGPVGVIILHMEMSGWLAETGITVTPITFGAKKADGSPYAPLSETARTDMQGMVDELGLRFAGHVAGRRGLAVADVVALQAGVLMPSGATPAGLIDEVAFEDEAFASLLSTLGTRGSGDASPPAQEADMGLKDKITAILSGRGSANAKLKRLGAAVAEDEDDKTAVGAEDDEEETSAEGEEDKPKDDEETAAEGEEDKPEDEDEDGPAAGASLKTAKAILDLPSAKGREKLARELAFAGMSVKTADRLLSAAPKAGGRLTEAMAGRDVNPGSGAGAGGKGDTADRMASNFAAAGGSTRLRKA